MGFLDNLENSLKNLETADERAADTLTTAQRRQAERLHAQAVAPFAEQLKASPFVAELMNHVTRIGYGRRMKVHILWLGDVLRMDARERRLELRPTATGTVVVFLENLQETGSRPLDLSSDAEALAKEWLEPAAR